MRVSSVVLPLGLPPQLCRWGDPGLREKCFAATRAQFVYVEERSPWSAAASFFEALEARVDADIWFPSQNDGTVEKMAALVEASQVYEDLRLEVLAWPFAPATRAALRFSPASDATKPEATKSPPYDASCVEEATLAWVDDVLGAQQMCPYTASRSRSATGLTSAGVSEGPVKVAVGNLLSTTFRQVSLLENTHEAEVATVLVCDPSLDDDFPRFLRVCDLILEPLLQQLGATALVGRAWFHPRYDNTHHDGTQLRPGHAIPPALAATFYRQYYPPPRGGVTSDDVSPQVGLDSLVARANERIRHTPHATVNLLRRHQLQAAQALEKDNPNKKPNAVYARNIARQLNMAMNKHDRR